MADHHFHRDQPEHAKACQEPLPVLFHVKLVLAALVDRHRQDRCRSIPGPVWPCMPAARWWATDFRTGTPLPIGGAHARGAAR